MLVDPGGAVPLINAGAHPFPSPSLVAGSSGALLRLGTRTHTRKQTKANYEKHDKASPPAYVTMDRPAVPLQSLSRRLSLLLLLLLLLLLRLLRGRSCPGIKVARQVLDEFACN